MFRLRFRYVILLSDLSIEVHSIFVQIFVCFLSVFLTLGYFLFAPVNRILFSISLSLQTVGSCRRNASDLNFSFLLPAVFIPIKDPAYNYGQESWRTLFFQGRFPLNSSPAPPLPSPHPNQIMLEACTQSFPESFNIVVGELPGEFEFNELF